MLPGDDITAATKCLSPAAGRVHPRRPGLECPAPRASRLHSVFKPGQHTQAGRLRQNTAERGVKAGEGPVLREERAQRRWGSPSSAPPSASKGPRTRLLAHGISGHARRSGEPRRPHRTLRLCSAIPPTVCNYRAACTASPCFSLTNLDKTRCALYPANARWQTPWVGQALGTRQSPWSTAGPRFLCSQKPLREALSGPQRRRQLLRVTWVRASGGVCSAHTLHAPTSKRTPSPAGFCELH